MATDAAPGAAPDVVRELLRPEAYGDLRPTRIDLRVTHASWVFLTEREVFKVKRPVDFGFLDFRTLEARRRACEREVELNRRLAPDVYLGTVPIRGTELGLRVGDQDSGAGPVVDWAVHMRRLPDEAGASALLAAGELGSVRIEQLARRLGAFLASAPSTPEHGTVAALRKILEENRSQTLPFSAPGDLVDAGTLEEIWRFQERELVRHPDRFSARVDTGRVRDGHGDLRLDHIYFLRDAVGVEVPIVIDCIEFNDRFRCGDVAGELAFLAMELEARGRPDLAAAFVARGTEALDDFEAYGVLDFYLCHRAWVRAKVAAFLARDEAQPWDIRMQKRDEARRCFSLARACAGRPATRPFLIAIGGLIGSGKSTLATTLGRELAIPVVSSDRTRKSLAGLVPTQRGGTALYSAEHTEATYRELCRRAGIVIESGHSVIVDATFAERRWRALLAETVSPYGTGLVFVEARCPDVRVLRERIRIRAQGTPESDATESLVGEMAARYEPRLPDEGGTSLAVDTCGAPELATACALAALAELGFTRPQAIPCRQR